MTLLPPGAGALLLLLAVVPGLLLEQPAKPAITVAAAAMPTKIRCFATGLLCLVADFCHVRAQGNRCRVIGDARARARPVRNITRSPAVDAVARGRSFETQRSSASKNG